ncbi:embryonic protein UVS.2-like isoform X1 [Ambystoma mexicanum]|uniref:embryonic protein UVS.2-like isoform X1 n=1 Tax=Ambystoma mexicanum TaxID=8296 RepID=UPI0037E8B77A
MELGTGLVAFACLLGCALAFPLSVTETASNTTGAWNETEDFFAATAAVDTGAGNETEDFLTATVAVDTGAGNETEDFLTATVAVDTGAGNETEDFLTATVAVDTGAGHETEDVLARIIAANRGARVPLMDVDILLINPRNAIACPNNNCLWPKSSGGQVLVPYVLSPDFGDYNFLFSAAMEEFKTMTCVNFVPRTRETDYVNIALGSGCYSTVGRGGGSQILSLSKNGCLSIGVIEHELMHNLGLYHEHSRKDRDNYIDIRWRYINRGDQPNFNKEMNANTLDLAYDYGSVMHYGRNALTNTAGQDTIIPKPDPNVPIGQRFGMSNLDIAKINKLYNCNLCRTLLNEPSGTITVNSRTVLPATGGSCLWLIRITAGQVFLWINDYNIQSSTSCQSNYLRVFDGNSRSSPIILDRTCGQGLGISLLASDSTMLVEFVYSNPSTSNRFNAKYNSGNCGGNFDGTSGTLTSPNYPFDYPMLTDCTWNILAPAGFKIALNMVTLRFTPQLNCMDDSLSIYDDAKPDSSLLGKYCRQFTGTLISYGNMLRLVFISPYPRENTGFLVTYSFFRFPILLNSLTGSIATPSYPTPYDNNAPSLWQIQLPANNKVSLWFNIFNIQASAGCTRNYVKVYDGSSQTAPVLMDKTCGQIIPLAITSSSNQMLVEFVANSFVAGNGFQASYGNAVPWITLSDATGYIFPANYRILYPNNNGSLWMIRVPSNKVLLDFSVGVLSTLTCISESIKVYDGSSTFSPVLLDMTCASGQLPSVVSSGNSMLVQFNNRGPILPLGFSPRYSTVLCGATLTSTSGTLTSPGFPGNYPASTDCTWMIIAPVRYKIYFTMTSFNLEGHPMCIYDYLMIYNGGSSIAPLIGKFCGATQIAAFTSTGSTLMIQFHSDLNVSLSGFMAQYSFVLAS